MLRDHTSRGPQSGKQKARRCISAAAVCRQWPIRPFRIRYERLGMDKPVALFVLRGAVRGMAVISWQKLGYGETITLRNCTNWTAAGWENRRR